MCGSADTHGFLRRSVNIYEKISNAPVLKKIVFSGFSKMHLVDLYAYKLKECNLAARVGKCLLFTFILCVWQN